MSCCCIVVIPVYNECACIREVCQEWLAVVETIPNAQLLVVDDGSLDATPQILEEVAASNSHMTLVQKVHSGHGPTIHIGYQRTLDLQCDWIFQVDSDRQFYPQDFYKLWKFRQRFDLILGWRAERDDRPIRILLGSIHRYLVRLVFGAKIPDPNVPFRLMRASLVARLLPRIPEASFAPNVLLAALAVRSGESVCCVPVHHVRRATGSESIQGRKLCWAAARSLKDMLRVRVRERGNL
jgi:dolichol-phosphate mannosyltransferase